MLEAILIALSIAAAFGLTYLFHKGVEYGVKEGLVKKDPDSRGE